MSETEIKTHFPTPFPYGNPLGKDESGLSLVITDASENSRSHLFSDPTPTTTVVMGSEKRMVSIERSEKSEQTISSKKNGSGVGSEDIELLVMNLCYEHGFITRKVTHRNILSNVSYRSVSNLFERLIKKGVLKRKNSSWESGRGIYQLTPKGYEIVSPLSDYEFQKFHKMEPYIFNHDEALLETRLILQDLVGGEWLPEKALRYLQYQEMPDGVLRVKDDFEIAVEVECSMKGPSRLKNLLNRWEKTDLSLVLYVCRDSKIFEFVKRVLEGVNSPELFALTTLERLRHGYGEVWTVNGPKKLPSKERMR